MNKQVMLEPGDIFLTQGNSFISKAIRFFSRTGGESRTEVNHVGIVVERGAPDEAVIVEASSTVKRHSMLGYFKSKNTKVAVFRPVNLTQTEINNIVLRAETYVGRKYGYLKIVAHFLDWMLGGRYVFRRITFMDKYPICSWVVAYAYAEEGYGFGVEPGSATPDDIWDFVYAQKDRYVMVHPLELFGGYDN